MLTSPHRDGDVIVIVASKGGEDTHPAWFLNLRENPQVVVTTRDSHERQMVAQVASPESRDRLWPIVTGKHTNYAGYQEKTDREIPLVLLQPPDEIRGFELSPHAGRRPHPASSPGRSPGGGHSALK